MAYYDISPGPERQPTHSFRLPACKQEIDYRPRKALICCRMFLARRLPFYTARLY